MDLSLDAAIKCNNMAMVELILKLKRRSKYSNFRVKLPQSGQRLGVSSGNTGKATFGFKVRKVNASKGGKEGNNAFTKDDQVRVRSLQDHFDLALQQGHWDMIELLLKELHKNGLPRVIEQISDGGLMHKAAELGHIEVVRKMVSILAENAGWGLNDLHSKVVQPQYADLGEFRDVSTTKKAMDGNFSVTPLVCTFHLLLADSMISTLSNHSTWQQ